MLDISKDRVQDIAHFATIDAEMDSGGREALLHFLQSYDFGAVDLRTILKTGALLDQKIATLPAERAGGSTCWSAANCPGAARWK